MELVLGSSIKTHFISLWKTRFVPAIISYAEKSSKKSVRDLILDLDESGKRFCHNYTLIKAHLMRCALIKVYTHTHTHTHTPGS